MMEMFESRAVIECSSHIAHNEHFPSSNEGLDNTWNLKITYVLTLSLLDVCFDTLISQTIPPSRELCDDSQPRTGKCSSTQSLLQSHKYELVSLKKFVCSWPICTFLHSWHHFKSRAKKSYLLFLSWNSILSSCASIHSACQLFSF